MNKSYTTRDWLAEVQRLTKERIFVQHNPPTPRYGRALAKLAYLIKESAYLGVRPYETAIGRVEIALWAPNPEGRGSGYYSCFRLFLEREVVTAALLFCFYDGTEKSPAFRTLTAAAEYARFNTFKETL